MKEKVKPMPNSSLHKETDYYSLSTYCTIVHGAFYRSPICKTFMEKGDYCGDYYFDELDRNILFRIGQFILNPKVVINYYKKWKHDDDFKGTYIRALRSPYGNERIRKHLNMTIWGHYIHEINATFEFDNSEHGYPDQNFKGKACVELTDDGLEGLKFYEGKRYTFFVHHKIMEHFADVKTEDEYYDLLSECVAKYAGIGVFDYD